MELIDKIMSQISDYVTDPIVTPKTIQRSFDRYGLKRSHKSGRRRLDGRIIKHD